MPRSASFCARAVDAVAFLLSSRYRDLLNPEVCKVALVCGISEWPLCGR